MDQLFVMFVWNKLKVQFPFSGQGHWYSQILFPPQDQFMSQLLWYSQPDEATKSVNKTSSNLLHIWSSGVSPWYIWTVTLWLLTFWMVTRCLRFEAVRSNSSEVTEVDGFLSVRASPLETIIGGDAEVQKQILKTENLWKHHVYLLTIQCFN